MEPLVSFLFDLFSVNSSTREFIIQSYLPQIKNAFSTVQISPVNTLALFSSTVATFAKLVFAFVFQEQTFMIDILTSPVVNEVGRPINWSERLACAVTELLVRAACVRCHGTKCPLLTA